MTLVAPALQYSTAKELEQPGFDPLKANVLHLTLLNHSVPGSGPRISQQATGHLGAVRSN
jgi:hypothetical protein